MPLCLSFLERPDEEVLRNHAHYCNLYGYAHQVVDSASIHHPILQYAFRYSQILRHLRSLDEGDWLLFLDADAVVFRPIAVDTLLAGRDSLIVEGPVKGSSNLEILRGMLVLRNTAAHRAVLHGMIEVAGRVVAMEIEHLAESVHLRALGALPCNAIIANTHVHVCWGCPGYWDSSVFVLNLAPLRTVGHDGGLVDDIWHDRTLQSLLTRQVNAALVHGHPVLQPPAYPALSDQEFSSYNADARIAFVTLYTPNIASYARVAEHNVKRYCDRHGYAYHVYRVLPQALGNAVQGNWAKPWVLRQHFAQHEWVIWIDADMLFVNPARAFDALLAGRDRLYTKDIAAWRVNSGLMGFRTTPENNVLLDRLLHDIEGVQDKSSVYASMGDQYFVNELLRELGLDSEPDVLDFVSVNTPHYLRTKDTLLTHFLGLGEPYRSVYMADQDRQSLLVR